MDINEAWAVAAGILAAIVLIGNAAEKIAKAIHAAKAPNARQDERLASLEAWKLDVDRKLADGQGHFETLDGDTRAIQLALLALLDHGIDGNNIDQLQKAKEGLRAHLVNR